MLDQGREPRASTLDINQPKESQTRTQPWHGVLLGTDFRHAVEFSKSGRARTPAFRPSFEAASRGAAQRSAPAGASRWPQTGSRAAQRESYWRRGGGVKPIAW